MSNLDKLPNEILIHILSYLYQCPDENISYKYHLNNNHLNTINKRFSTIIKENKDMLSIYDPIDVITYYWTQN